MPDPKPYYNKEATDWAGFVKMLDQFVDGTDLSTFPLDLKNEDGSTNYGNLIRVLKAPEFSEYRDSNPDIFNQAQTDVAASAIAKAIPVATDLAKLGFSLNQLKRGKKMDDTLPAYPSKPQRNNYLRRALSDSYTRSKEGLSAAERSVYNRQSTRDFDKSRQALIETSGGQGGAVQSGMQVASERQRQARLGEMAASSNVRRQNAAQHHNLVEQSLQEDQRMQNFDTQRFMYRTLPQWRQRTQAKSDLMRAGYENTFGAVDSLAGRGVDVANMFKGGVPGTVYPNSYYQNFTPGNDMEAILKPVFDSKANNIVMDLQQMDNHYEDPYSFGNEIAITPNPNQQYPWQE